MHLTDEKIHKLVAALMEMPRPELMQHLYWLFDKLAEAERIIRESSAGPAKPTTPTSGNT